VRLGVACAGVIDIVAPLDVAEARWDRTMAINLKGTFFTFQALARSLSDVGGEGSMVAISSTSGRVGRRDCIDYAASKAGVISVVRSLSLALAPAIRVNAVCRSRWPQRCPRSRSGAPSNLMTSPTRSFSCSPTTRGLSQARR